VSKEGTSAQVNPLLVGLIALFFFLYVGAEVSFGGWIFTFTTALKLANAAEAAYITSAFWGSLTIGRLLAIPIATRVRPRMMLFTDLLGCLASVGIILLWSNSLVAVWLGTLGIGLSMASIFPTTLSFAERRLTITGQVTGWFFVGAGAGGMVLPWLIGQLFDSVGPRVTMLGILGDIILESFVFVILIVYSSARVRQKTGASE
jgi:FHS family Na+ dependent glucose MFS transporter 1